MSDKNSPKNKGKSGSKSKKGRVQKVEKQNEATESGKAEAAREETLPMIGPLEMEVYLAIHKSKSIQNGTGKDASDGAPKKSNRFTVDSTSTSSKSRDGNSVTEEKKLWLQTPLSINIPLPSSSPPIKIDMDDKEKLIQEQGLEEIIWKHYKYLSLETSDKKIMAEKIMRSHPENEFGENDKIYFTKFYQKFSETIRSTMDLNKILNEFSAIDNDYDRIKYVLQFNEVREMKICSTTGKSEPGAAILEDCYDSISQNKDKCLKKCLEILNKCLQLTPEINKKLMGIRYMKRAWVHLMTDKLEEAKLDSRRSLGYYNEPALSWSNFEILGYCYAKVFQYPEAKCHFLKALEGLKICSMDQNMKKKIKKRINDILENMKKVRVVSKSPESKKSDESESKKFDESESKKSTPSPKFPELSYGENTILKCASEAVEVKTTEDAGKGLWAKRDIKPGDVIIVENSFVKALDKDKLQTHCIYCYNKLWNPIPCKICSRVWFCNEKCLEDSTKITSYDSHLLECRVLDHLYDETVGNMGIIAFKILSRVQWDGVKYLRNLRKIDTQLPDSDTRHTAFDFNEKYFTEDYLNTYKLITNAQKRSFGDLFKKSVSAVYIKRCLDHIYLFSEKIGDDIDIFVTSLVLRHMQGASCNAYGINEFVVKDNCIDNVSVLQLAGCIYPTVSLINHSCSPNVYRYNIGKSCVVRATNLIKKGEQLFDLYDHFYEVTEREERQNHLMKIYKFECKCVACREEWPLFKDNNSSLKFNCPENCHQVVKYNWKKRIICPSCGYTPRLKILTKTAHYKVNEFYNGVKLLRAEFMIRAFAILRDFQIYLDMHTIAPSICSMQCQEYLKRYFILERNKAT